MADFVIPLKLETAEALRSIQAVKASMEQMSRAVQQDIQQRLAQSASVGGAASAGAIAAQTMGPEAAAAGAVAGAAGAGGAGAGGLTSDQRNARARAVLAPLAGMFNQAEGGAFGMRTGALQDMALNAEIPFTGVKIGSVVGAVAPGALGQLKADRSASNQVLDFAEQMGRAGGQMSQPEAQHLFKRFHAQETRGLDARMKARDAIEGETSMGRGLNFVMEKISSLFEKGAAYQEHEH